MGDGVLILDEVKVISRLMWNSRSQKIVWIATSEEDQVSLHDIYQQFSRDGKVKQTFYVLQFLWRDLTSEFGPVLRSSQLSLLMLVCLTPQTVPGMYLRCACMGLCYTDFRDNYSESAS